MLIQKSYQFVAAPKPYQQIMLFEWGSALRFVWNWGLKQRIDVYTASEGRVSISYIDQQNQLPALKLQFKFLKSAPSSCLQNVLRDLDKAFAAFFAGRSGFPKKKKARRGDSCGMRFPDSLAFRLVDKCGIIIPKLGRIKLRAIRPIEGKMKNVLLSRRGEKWLISIQVEQEISSPIRRTDSPIGLDAGVSNPLSDNLGNFYKLPVASEKEAKWIKKLQRNAARKKVGSKRREKSKQAGFKSPS